MPSICTTRRSRPESSAASHSRSRVLDSATKCREAADFDTPDPAGAGTSPSGSRTARRNFRVDVLRLQGFLRRNGHPHQLLNPEADAPAKILIERFHIDPGQLPIVLCPSGQLLRNPGEDELARCLGL